MERPRDLGADGKHPRSFQREITVRAPDLVDPELPEEHEARRVDIGQPVTAKALELPEHGLVVARVEREQPEAGQIAHGEAEGAGGILAEPVEKPAVGLGYDGQRREPSPWRVSEESGRRLMIFDRSGRGRR